MKLLMELLNTTTPSGSEKPVRNIVLRETARAGQQAIVDSKGNVIVTIGDSKSLFLSHMDSVHNKDPMTLVCSKKGIVALAPKCGQRALGADDKAGVRVMLHMIKNGIAGTYAFCVEEEVGCKGSTFLEMHLDMAGIVQAISFDRRGTSSIITDMAAGVCCSDEFAGSLSRELSSASKHHTWKADPTGSITDSLSFSGKVINYTNISVGYENEHSKKETLNSFYLLRVLLPAVIDVRWEALSEVAPTPKPEHAWWDDYGYRDAGFGSLHSTSPVENNTFDHLWDYFNDHRDEGFSGDDVLDIIEAIELGLDTPAKGETLLMQELEAGHVDDLDPISMSSAMQRWGV